MSLILAYQNRGVTHDITINEVDGTAYIPAAADEIRVIIGREGATPKLTVASNVPTANGSTFTKNTPSDGVNRLRLDASDLDFEPGTYTLFLDLYDAGDAAEWKNVDRQVFCLEET